MWTWTLDLVFPPKCPFCQQLLEDPRAPVCPTCQPVLPWLEGPRARRQVAFTDGCYSPLAYRDPVPQAFHRYKFSGVRACQAPFGLLMAQCLRDHLPEEAELITWAPLSRRRLWARGFDQARLLAQMVGRSLDIPVRPTLVKTRHTRPQSGLDQAEARRANALGVYAPRRGADVSGKTVVLVDDVVTSGATLSECAQVLRRMGAAAVYCLTLAQARPDSRAEAFPAAQGVQL
ncbi:MAG: ComF family protein [Lawsonibacter sp.]|nr:ComF family protein [Lawsonibacter sp.]